MPDHVAPTIDIAEPPPTALGRIPAGTRLGRYLLADAIGEGGSGVVYAAHDPELNRRLAIKLVRQVARTQARLLREAQAMARLSHPNVVHVYDVGTFRDQVFVAMEFVDGGTLREWLSREARPRKEILRVFLLAGRGLAAAHDAGFVHRDFKPDNVLIGSDGSVRVTDFGLARVQIDNVSAITAANKAVGTPGYMAPEQYTGGRPDPRSDQFGFCAALYEALYGRLPFEGDTNEGIRVATLAGRRARTDSSSGIPGTVDRALARGLALVPDNRFPSMRALLAALDPKPHAAWARAGAVAAAGCALVGVAWELRATSRHEALCRGAESHLAGVWDATQREQVRQSFRATGLPYADAAFAGVSAQLDRFASDWVAMRTDACRAVRVRGEQSEEEFAVRTACLDNRLRELAALVPLLASADRDVVRLAVEAGGRLSPVNVCADIAALTALVAPPRDPRARGEVDAIRGRLADARALAATGKLTEAVTAAERALAEARKTGYAPLVAEALVALGEAQTGAGRYDDATRVLADAVVQADEARHDEARVRALVALAEVNGRWLGHYARAAEYATDAVAVARRIHDARLESFALEQASREHGFTDELDRAVDEAKASAVLTDRFFDPNDLRRARVHSSASVALSELAQFDEALQEDELALAIAERALGPIHPALPEYLQDLALDLVWTGRAADAIPYEERAVDIVRAQLGTDHPRYASAINNLAYAELPLGRYADAIALNARALAIWEQSFGPEHGENAYALTAMGEAYLGETQPAKALPLLERAVHLVESNGLEAETMGDARFFYGVAIWETTHDRARAEALVRRAIASYGHVPRLTGRRTRAEVWLAARAASPAR